MNHLKPIDAVNLALNLLIQASRISIIAQRAQLEGRYKLKPEEIKAIQAERDTAFDALDAAIGESEAEEIEPEVEKPE